MTREARRLTLVWLILSLLTVVSWWGGTRADAARTAVSTAVLGIAFFKSRLVLRHFMEVREAPGWLRLICDGWLVALFALLFASYSLRP